jgi:tRNA-splicing ligase RtcB
MPSDPIKLIRLEEYLWEIPREGGMRVPGRIYASDKLMTALKEDNSLRQVMNVAHLPGIVGYSLAMPDIHWGYGFPIGGVAAVDDQDGVISPGGVGYDIN